MTFRPVLLLYQQSPYQVRTGCSHFTDEGNEAREVKLFDQDFIQGNNRIETHCSVSETLELS